MAINLQLLRETARSDLTTPRAAIQYLEELRRQEDMSRAELNLPAIERAAASARTSASIASGLGVASLLAATYSFVASVVGDREASQTMALVSSGSMLTMASSYAAVVIMSIREGNLLDKFKVKSDAELISNDRSRISWDKAVDFLKKSLPPDLLTASDKKMGLNTQLVAASQPEEVAHTARQAAATFPANVEIEEDRSAERFEGARA